MTLSQKALQGFSVQFIEHVVLSVRGSSWYCPNEICTNPTSAQYLLTLSPTLLSLTHSASATLTFLLEYVRNAPSHLWAFALTLSSVWNTLPTDFPLVSPHLLQVSAQIIESQGGQPWPPLEYCSLPSLPSSSQTTLSYSTFYFPQVLSLFKILIIYCQFWSLLLFFISFHKNIRFTVVGVFVLLNDVFWGLTRVSGAW